MLKLEILELNLKDKKAFVKASLPMRSFKKDKIYDFSREHVCEAVSNKLKEQSKEILNCNFLTKPKHLNNIYPDSLREFVLEVQLEIKQKPIPKKPKKYQSSSSKLSSSSSPRSRPSSPSSSSSSISKSSSPSSPKSKSPSSSS